MRYFHHPFKNAILSACFVIPLLTCACGDDDSSYFETETSSSSAKEDIRSSDDNQGSGNNQGSDYKDSSAIGDKYKTQNGTTITIVKGEVLDKKNGRTYKTVKFGPYTWMAENADYSSSKSICYDDKSANCEKNGSLYPDSHPEDACPEGFTIPTKADYKYMTAMAGDVTSEAFGFDPQMSGYCTKKDGKITCSDKGKAAYLLTSEYTYFRIANTGPTSFSSTKSDDYYAIRCMKVTHIVDTDEELPDCRSISDPNDFFVAEKKSNFTCNGNYWSNAKDNSCPHTDKGEKHYYKDTLYICDGYDWVLATMNDTDAECDDENKWEIQKLNDTQYLCDGSTWRKPSGDEEKLGFCTPSAIGKMNSTVLRNDTTDYYCDTTGWRPATLTDYIGECTDKNKWEEATHKNKHYICKVRSWYLATPTEDSLGFCKPSRGGTLDSMIVSGEVRRVYCDSSIWRFPRITDFEGECDSSKFYKVAALFDTTYTCRTTKKWTVLDSIEQGIGVCSPKIKGKIDSLKNDSISYYCDSTKWRTATVQDYYGPCDSSKLYTEKIFHGVQYGCMNARSWEKMTAPTTEFGFCTPELKGTLKLDKKGILYICDSTWRKPTLDEALGECGTSNEGTIKHYSDNAYACDNGRWRKASTRELTELGLCTNALRDSIRGLDTNAYICKDTGWVWYAGYHNIGGCSVDERGTTKEFLDRDYVCKRNGWLLIDSVEAALGLCLEGSFPYNKAYQYGEDYYQCAEERWIIAPPDLVLPTCTEDNFGEQGTYRDKEYYCSANQTWQEYSDLEKALGLCSPEKQEGLYEYNGIKYGCTYMSDNGKKKFFWRAEDSLDKLLGFCHAKEYTWKGDGDKDYLCDSRGETGKWKDVTNSFLWGAYTGCDDYYSYKYGVTVRLQGEYYYCNESVDPKSGDNHGWYKLQPIDEVSGPCHKEIVGEAITFEGAEYTCGKNDEGYYRWLAE